jgi:exopolysaccharide biosynthesis polyprenyl glycosylphosphotransferase
MSASVSSSQAWAEGRVEGAARDSRGKVHFWMALDAMTILASVVLATVYRMHTSPWAGAREFWHGTLIHGRSMSILLALLCFFAFSLVITSQRLNLYSPTRLNNILQEQRLSRDVLEQARIHGVGLRMVPEMYDSLALNSSIEYIGQFPTIPLHRGHVPEVRLLLKRGLDVVFSSMVLILVSPLFLVIAIAIKLDSHGPVFYAAERVGKKGRVFRCVKFRTMVSDAEQRRVDLMHRNERDGVLFKIANDPRITKLGRFLRKHSLDEFPQFFNVLCGDMSVVGPRPPLRSEVRAYELSHLRRLAVTPGITGLWQVHARQEPSFDSYITMDTIYIENWSIWLDLRIILRTFGVVLAGTGT